MARSATTRAKHRWILLVAAGLLPAPAAASILVLPGMSRSFDNTTINEYLINDGTCNAHRVEVRGDAFRTFWGDGANVYNRAGGTFYAWEQLVFYSWPLYMMGRGYVSTGELQNHGSFHIGQFGNVHNMYGTMYNAPTGVIENRGLLRNSSSRTEQAADGTTITYSSSIHNLGTIRNMGVVQNGTSMNLGGTGTFINLSGGRLENRGQLQADSGGTGKLINQFEGVVYNGESSDQSSVIRASIWNHWTFHNYAQTYGNVFDNRSVLINHAGGRMHVYTTFESGFYALNEGQIVTSGEATNFSQATLDNRGSFRANNLTNRGRFDNTGDLQVSNILSNESLPHAYKTFNQQAGSLNARETHNAGDLNYSGGAIRTNALLNTGLFKGAGTVSPLNTDAVLFTNSGTVSPGLPLGQLTIAGDYRQTATGLLVMELGGLNRSVRYDVLDITRTAYLAGTLEVRLISGFLPAIGDEFNLLHALAVEGTFDTVWLPELTQLMAWSVTYTDADVWLRVVAIPEPSSLVFVVLGLLGLTSVRRKARP